MPIIWTNHILIVKCKRSERLWSNSHVTCAFVETIDVLDRWVYFNAYHQKAKSYANTSTAFSRLHNKPAHVMLINFIYSWIHIDNLYVWKCNEMCNTEFVLRRNVWDAEYFLNFFIQSKRQAFELELHVTTFSINVFPVKLTFGIWSMNTMNFNQVQSLFYSIQTYLFLTLIVYLWYKNRIFID